MEFFQAVARIMTAVCLGQEVLRACFHDPDGFNAYTAPPAAPAAPKAPKA